MYEKSRRSRRPSGRQESPGYPSRGTTPDLLFDMVANKVCEALRRYTVLHTSRACRFRARNTNTTQPLSTPETRRRSHHAPHSTNHTARSPMSSCYTPLDRSMRRADPYASAVPMLSDGTLWNRLVAGYPTCKGLQARAASPPLSRPREPFAAGSCTAGLCTPGGGGGGGGSGRPCRRGARSACPPPPLLTGRGRQQDRLDGTALTGRGHPEETSRR